MVYVYNPNTVKSYSFAITQGVSKSLVLGNATKNPIPRGQFLVQVSDNQK